MLKAIAHPSALDRSRDDDGLEVFDDGHAAGVLLARRLRMYGGTNALVLGIPRSGMPVAAAVAQALDAELDFIVARKLSAPESAQLAIGAVTADGGRYLNEELIRELAVSPSYVERVTQVEMIEAKRRAQLLRGDGTAPRISGRIVLLVDDGLATGATMIAAARAVRAQHPRQLIIAAPVSSRAAFRAVKKEADIVECLTTPLPFWAVGAHYRSSQQTEDAEVEQLLHDARERRGAVHTAAAV